MKKLLIIAIVVLLATGCSSPEAKQDKATTDNNDDILQDDSDNVLLNIEGTWEETESGMRYLTSTDEYVINDVVSIEGNLFYFNKKGILDRTPGWKSIDDVWCLIAQFASTDCPFRMNGAGSSVEAV